MNATLEAPPQHQPPAAISKAESFTSPFVDQVREVESGADAVNSRMNNVLGKNGASSGIRTGVTVTSEMVHVVIPTCESNQDVDRIAGIRKPVAAIAADIRRGTLSSDKVRIWVGGNNITRETGSRISDEIRGVASEFGVPVNYEIVDASGPRNAAHARNRVLQHIYGTDGQATRDMGHTLFMDDDAFPVPGSIRTQLDILNGNSHNTSAVGANVKNTAATEMDRHFDEALTLAQQAYEQDPQFVELASVFDVEQQVIQLAEAIAFGSKRTMKTSGTLVNGGVVKSIMDKTDGNYFEGFGPGRTWEDPAADLRVHPFGKRVIAKGAIVHDQVRESLLGLVKQQIQWGSDQVSVVKFALRTGFLKPGLTVLEAHEDRWIQYRLPTEVARGFQGVFISPRDFLSVDKVVALRRLARDAEGAFAKLQNFVPSRMGLHMLGDICKLARVIDGQRNDLLAAGQVCTIENVPAPTNPPRPDDPRYTLRDSQDAWAARILGNMAGMAAHAQIETKNGRRPEAFLIGPRQYTA